MQGLRDGGGVGIILCMRAGTGALDDVVEQLREAGGAVGTRDGLRPVSECVILRSRRAPIVAQIEHVVKELLHVRRGRRQLRVNVPLRLQRSID